jgi:tetratricopeptide (TPR) repeat protein
MKILTLSEKRKQIAEAKKRKKAKNPPQEILIKLLEHYQNKRYEDAEKAAIQTIQQFPYHQFAWKLLAAVYKDLGRLTEALNASQKAAELGPNDVEAHSNLGIISYELGNLEEAIAAFKMAITIQPDFVHAHFMMGKALARLDRLEEAEAGYRQAIVLKSDFAEAYFDLGVLIYPSKGIDSSLENIQKAYNINPKHKDCKLALTIFKSRKAQEEINASSGNTNKSSSDIELTSNPLILNRSVEKELITSLYEMNTRELDSTTDARYGNGRCSPDFQLFENRSPIINTLAEDLINTIKLAVKSDVHIYDSFFNIIGAGGGTTPHKHINVIDTDVDGVGLDFGKQKFSLVYYLKVGNQNCSEPGILKVYDPNEDILPSEGMIVLIPAHRSHSAVYNGEEDRVMIGINFYAL